MGRQLHLCYRRNFCAWITKKIVLSTFQNLLKFFYMVVTAKKNDLIIEHCNISMLYWQLTVMLCHYTSCVHTEGHSIGEVVVWIGRYDEIPEDSMTHKENTSIVLSPGSRVSEPQPRTISRTLEVHNYTDYKLHFHWMKCIAILLFLHHHAPCVIFQTLW